ncbi:hypothetical protein GCK72_022420 [Caenorhabditis remanei]|nr:hypothetical protein GCK72_022420 [Caenorhabditis remanei]KAF1745971.1 hypothetical protein GCK72_022420 [Caenorhabditis remanei]
MVCANDIQLAQRNSIWFQFNVAAKTGFAIGIFLNTAIFFYRLFKKNSHFSTSMNALLVCNVLSSNFHSIIYGYIQNCLKKYPTFDWLKNETQNKFYIKFLRSASNSTSSPIVTPQ